MSRKKIILFANTGWYLFNFRLSLARTLVEKGNDIILMSPDDEYSGLLRKEGFIHLSIPMSRREANPLREIATILRITSVYKRERPDLVHHFTIKPVIYGSISARLAGVPAVVNSITGLGYVFGKADLMSHLLRPLIIALYRLALSDKNLMAIFQNQEDLDRFVGMGLIQRHRTCLIKGSGVDIQRFSPCHNRPRNDAPVVLFASRLLWEKGVKEFVDSARLLKKKGINCRFLLAGSPDPGNPMSVKASDLAEWDREGSIEVLGHRGDMVDVLRMADIVVLPSYHEGAPKILFEAASMEKPIVATDVAGCRNIVEHGVNGLLVPAKDVYALTEAIKRLIFDSDLCRRMGKAGREKVLSEFDERIIIEKTIGVYNRLLK